MVLAWGTTSRPKQWQQIVHLSIGSPLRDQSNGNKSYVLALGFHFITKQRQQIVYLSIGAPLRGQSNGNKSHFLAVVHHFETKTTARNRTEWNWGTTSTKQRQQIVHSSIWGTTSRKKRRQQIVHLRIWALFRDQSNGNTSCILAMGHHSETKVTTTNSTC